MAITIEIDYTSRCRGTRRKTLQGIHQGQAHSTVTGTPYTAVREVDECTLGEKSARKEKPSINSVEARVEIPIIRLNPHDNRYE